jgi:peptidoglycan/xylan/chitin deacetylase (PgdA/CDA1 family)
MRRALDEAPFDDGYRDMLNEALPVLERRRAPFTVYCVTGGRRIAAA